MDAANTGRATKFSTGLRRKVNVDDKMDDAVVAFEDVEKNAGYILETDYENIFAVTNETTKSLYLRFSLADLILTITVGYWTITE
jgi:hypothetical protein